MLGRDESQYLETQYSYDPAGRTKLVVRKPLSGGLAAARRELAINYYDANGRITAAVDWGTNKPDPNWNWDTAGEPVPWNYQYVPATPGTSSDTHYVTTYDYGYDAGESAAYSSVTSPIDSAPRTKTNKSFFDKLGRTTEVNEDSSGISRVTRYTFNNPVGGASSWFDEIIAENPPGDDQTTEYYRADTRDATLVTKVHYPDGGDVTSTYYDDGTLSTRTDQRNWTTTFQRDALGRVTRETVTGTGLTGTTLVGYEYDALGRTVISYDNGYALIDGGSYGALVQSTYEWDGTNQIVSERQNCGAEVSAEFRSVLDKLGRRTSVTYPNDRTISFAYDPAGRMTLAEEADGTDIVRYAYQGDYVSTKTLGAGESGVVQRPSKTTADLDHFDAFGRPIVWQYKKTFDATDQVLLKYNYDYASDITWRYDDKMQTAHSKNWSQKYTYDTLVRLTQAEQGAIGGTWPGSPTMTADHT